MLFTPFFCRETILKFEMSVRPSVRPSVPKLKFNGFLNPEFQNVAEGTSPNLNYF